MRPSTALKTRPKIGQFKGGWHVPLDKVLDHSENIDKFILKCQKSIDNAIGGGVQMREFYMLKEKNHKSRK